MADNAAEIAKIEHELEILRSRYAIFERWGKVLKWFFIGVSVVVSTSIVGYGLIHDPVVAIIMIIVVVVIVGAFYLTGDYRALRWIDAASPAPGWPNGRMFNIGPKSEAAAIEGLIADREARLAELRSSGQ